MKVGDINTAVLRLVGPEVYVDVEALAEIQAKGYGLAKRPEIDPFQDLKRSDA